MLILLTVLEHKKLMKLSKKLLLLQIQLNVEDIVQMVNGQPFIKKQMHIPHKLMYQ